MRTAALHRHPGSVVAPACGKKAPPPAPTASAPAPAPAPDAATPAPRGRRRRAAPGPDAAAPAPEPDAAPALAADAAAPAAEADAAAPAPAPEAGACAPGDVVTADLAALEKSFGELHTAFEGGAWPRAEARRAGPGIDDAKVPKFAPLLRQLGLEELASDVDIAKDETSFDVFDCTFARQDLASEPGAHDVLVSIACQNDAIPDAQDGDTLFAGVVLRPAADPAKGFCRLGVIAKKDSRSARPCLAPDADKTPAWKLTPVELVAAGRQAIREDVSSGSCGDGTLRGDHITTSFWGVEGGKLVEYFTGVLDDVWYESPCPPTNGRTGKIELGDSFPKVITYSVEAVCEA
ncbi:MAG: hypothetical protein U1F43_20270 [Myxococcota bacterium]